MKNCDGLGDSIPWGKDNLDWKTGITFNFPIIYQSKKLYRLIKLHFSDDNLKNEEENESEDFLKKIRLIDLKKYEDIDDIDGRGKSSLSNIKNKIEEGYDLIFLHINIPRLGGSSEYVRELFNLDPKSEFESFMLNTLLADLMLGKLMSELSNYSKDDFMLTVVSDHWYREKDRKTSKYYPSLLMSKILSDNSKVTTMKNNSLIYLKEYVINYFEGKISSNKDIKSFFQSKKFYEPYINE